MLRGETLDVGDGGDASGGGLAVDAGGRVAVAEGAGGFEGCLFGARVLVLGG